MGHRFAAIAFTDGIREQQRLAGSRAGYSAMESGPDYNHVLTAREAEFIAERDSMYMASVSETGWPYLQHRGGPRGFVNILDERTLAFVDYAGNRQYVSTGNFQANDRVALFFMDYPNRRRLKLLGRVHVAELDATSPALETSDYPAVGERLITITVEAFDWNCPQHITPRFTADEMPASRIEQQQVNAIVQAGLGEYGSGPLSLTVSGMRQLTPTIRSYELRSPDGTDLPLVEPGSHIRVPVVTAGGVAIEREYSISSNTSDRTRWEIAVRYEPEGEGGSAAVHEKFMLGTRLNVDSPANQFPLHDTGEPAVLIAGGIGITPIRSMAYQLADRRAAFTLHYAGRARDEMAYLDELEVGFPDRVVPYAAAENERMDLEALLKGAPSDAIFYVCGPYRLTHAVLEAAAQNNIARDRVRFELFR